MLNLGVLVSGSGTNLQSIIDEIEAGKLDASIKVVISNKESAFALERAGRHKIPKVIVKKSDYPLKEDFDREIVRVLESHGVELVILAGFMRIVTPVLINAFPMRIMNIHPSLLPSFPGLDGQKQALEHGVKISGCTVHFVEEGLDSGPIIIQAAVPVLEDDTAESLSKRILSQEHRIYPEAIRLFAQGRLEVTGRRVRIKDAATHSGMLVNPA